MTKGKEINGQQPHTLLATNARLVNPGSLVLFIAIFYGLWIKQHSQCKLCEAEHLQPWTKVANGITVGASCGIFLTQLVRVFSAHFGHAHGHNTLSALHTLLLLTFFAAFSQVVSLIDVFENMCADGIHPIFLNISTFNVLTFSLFFYTKGLELDRTLFSGLNGKFRFHLCFICV